MPLELVRKSESGHQILACGSGACTSKLLPPVDLHCAQTVATTGSPLNRHGAVAGCHIPARSPSSLGRDDDPWYDGVHETDASSDSGIQV